MLFKKRLPISIVFLLCVHVSCQKEMISLDYEMDMLAGLTGDNYGEIVENPFIDVIEEAISTFSIDADGASYANTRRFISQDNQLPPVGITRTEEMINYFDLNYPYETSMHPISLHGEVSTCPWNETNKLIRIGMKGMPLNEPVPTNFVLLIVVSGSMGSDDKLPLLQEGFKLLVDEMDNNDRLAIVSYAGEAGIVLESTSGGSKNVIKNAIDCLSSGGSTAGAAGIISAYEIAEANFITGGNNRIIIGTDGDFNVGISNHEELLSLIEEKRTEANIYLSVLGVGRGNLNDYTLEQIANHGNGTYEYLDNVLQLKKVFVYEYQKFYTVAKDVKVQVAFNPDNVISYRLIGYENRMLENEAFENDSTDAGEIGANQNITALYEIVPKNNANYRDVPTFTIDFRYKLPDENTSIPLELEIFDEGNTFEEASEAQRFTSSVAAFGMLLNESAYLGTSSYDNVLTWSEDAITYDPYGFKNEFRTLVTIASEL